MTSRKGPIRVLHFGLGPIGAAIVRQVASRPGFKVVGGVDVDPAKVGRDVGEIAGVGRSLRVRISDDPRKAIKASKPDVVVLCTQSSLKKVMPQMEAILKHTAADRLDDRGAGVSLRRQPALRPRAPSAGQEGEGCGARHRREPGLHHGCACRSRSRESASGWTRCASIGFRMPACAGCRSSRRSAPA